MRTWVMVLVALSVLGVSVVVAIAARDPEWFARAGSLVTIIGLTLMVKRNLLCVHGNTEEALVEKLHYSPSMPQPGTERYERELARARRILRDEALGLTLSITGTITWGYGDLLIGLLMVSA